MRVDGDGTASVLDPDDLGRFAVEVPEGLDLGVVGAALAGRVRFDSAELAWVDQAWLRATGGFDTAERAGGFTAMVAAATKRGWVDRGSGDIAGHVHRIPGGAR